MRSALSGYMSALESGLRKFDASTQAQRQVLDVSIADVAWRKLPLGESQVTMTLTFDSGCQ